MMISIIVAVDRNWVIGGDDGIPWHLPSDLRRFRKLTMGNPCIMGRTTHEHIGKPLDGRLNIVLSRRPGYQAHGCHVASTLADAISFAKATGAAEAMVIGGAEIYQQAEPIAHRVYLTAVNGEFPGDKKFLFQPNVWAIHHTENRRKDEKNPYAHRFMILNHVHAAYR